MLQDHDQPRAVVSAFSRIMERKLQLNAHKGHWGGCPVEWLLTRLREEVDELETALREGRPAKVVQYETADIGNFAMMIADNYAPPTPTTAS
jgi:NTP pyrophosphatase (non-canonical NTP hydrolase)